MTGTAEKNYPQDLTYRAAFLADILAHPGDPAPRLILADWLEDHDEPDLAAWRRRPLAGRGVPRSAEYHQTLERAHAVLGDLIPRGLTIGYHDGLARESLARHSADIWWPNSRGVLAVIRFGFVTELAMSQRMYLTLGPELVRRVPLTGVRLIGADPRETSRRLPDGRRVLVWVWDRFSPRKTPAGTIPARSGPLLVDVLFRRLPPGRQFRTIQDAHAAAGLACVNWARVEAGMEPLEGETLPLPL